MKVIADAGPLMALAKVDGVGALFLLYPDIWVSTELCQRVIEILDQEA